MPNLNGVNGSPNPRSVIQSNLGGGTVVQGNANHGKMQDLNVKGASHNIGKRAVVQSHMVKQPKSTKGKNNQSSI